jgi:hypothetical protein
VDVVINPKKSLLKAEFEEILKEVAAAFEVIPKKASGKNRVAGRK